MGLAAQTVPPRNIDTWAILIVVPGVVVLLMVPVVHTLIIIRGINGDLGEPNVHTVGLQV